MIIDVKLFALAKELAGADSIRIELPAQATIAVLRAAICEAHPKLAPVMGQVMLAVDTEYAGDEQILEEGAEVACIPPVSGG